MSDFPKVTHKGSLEIGDTKIPCAVLDDGTRVLSETGISNAILKSRSGAAIRKKAENVGALLPVFLVSESLKPFISKDLEVGAHVINYMDGKRELHGYDATILPLACDVWLQAREAGALKPNQLDKAQNAEILMRSLAKVGIIALIDEATGYEKDRQEDELQKILSAYISAELLPWAKIFPDEFYKEIYRLKDWEYNGHYRNSYVGKLTTFLTYKRLPEGVLDELKRLNPMVQGKNYRRHTLHQRLSKIYGYTQLRDMIYSSMALMRACDSWDEFETMFRRSYNIPIDEKI